MSHRLQDSDPRTLAKMLSLTGDEDVGDFAAGDFAAMLKHQLDSNLASQLELSADKRSTTPPPATFRNLFAMEKPPAYLLEEVKNFAKRLRSNGRGAGETLGTVMYYAAIAAALARCDLRISELSSTQLKEGFAWAREQSAGQSELVALFESANGRV